MPLKDTRLGLWPYYSAHGYLNGGSGGNGAGLADHVSSLIVQGLDVDVGLSGDLLVDIGQGGGGSGTLGGDGGDGGAGDRGGAGSGVVGVSEGQFGLEDLGGVLEEDLTASGGDDGGEDNLEDN